MHFTLGHPSREQARPFLALGVLLLASSALFFRLGGRTFHGDELGSLLEASQLGQNANSLLYFLLLSGWQELGQGEFWLRALSALIAITAVAATYSWARLAAGARLAWRTALLLATSAYFVSYGQEIRFYSLALLVSSLSLFAFTLYTRRPTWTTALGWAASAGLAVLSLLLNGLVVLGEGTAYFALTPRL